MRARILLPTIAMLLALPASAAAAPGVCTYDAGTQIATYEWPTTISGVEVPNVQRFGAGNEQIKVGLGSTACGAATVNNTKEVRIIGTPPASSVRDDFAVVLANGVMAPGSGATGEVKVTFVSPGRLIYVRVTGSPNADHITAGANGVNVNADEAADDVDVAVTGAGSSMQVTGIGCTDTACTADGSGGNDVLKTTGNDGTGAAAPGSFARSSRVFGGPGADTIDIARYTAVLPGADADTVTGPGAQSDPFSGTTVDYRGTTSGVTVDLQAPAPQATGGSGTDTLVGVQHVVGTSNPDTLRGDGNMNRLSSEGAGADLMEGRGGPDELGGGSGNDTLHGGTGDDDLKGNGGNDTLHGEADDDTLWGEIGTGGPGDDTLIGGPGDDAFIPAVGDDTVDGGPGTDELRFAYVLPSAITFDLAVTSKQNTGGGGLKTVSAVENISGSPQSETFFGDDGPNTIHGGFGGTDTLDGRGGNDTVRKFVAGGVARGGPGMDTVSGSDGADVLEGGPGPDTISAAKGDDILRGPADGEKDTLFCGEGVDTTEHDEGLDTLNACENGTGSVFVPPPVIETPVTPDAPAPVAPTPSPPIAAAPAPSPALPALKASAVIKLPAASKRCSSRRTLTINLVQPAGVAFTGAKVTLKAGKKQLIRRLKPKKAGKGLMVDVDLRGLPKGRFTVAIELTTADGRAVKASRAYRTCTPKRKR